MTISDLKNGYSRFFQKVDISKKWWKKRIAKSGYLQKMDNSKKWIFCNSTAGVRFQ